MIYEQNIVRRGNVVLGDDYYRIADEKYCIGRGGDKKPWNECSYALINQDSLSDLCVGFDFKGKFNKKAYYKYTHVKLKNVSIYLFHPAILLKERGVSKPITLTYVHELQNYFFEKHGEELEINW